MKESFTVSSKGGDYSVEFTPYDQSFAEAGVEAIYVIDKKVFDLYSLGELIDSERLLVVEASEKLKSFPEGVTQILEFFTFFKEINLKNFEWLSYRITSKKHCKK